MSNPKILIYDVDRIKRTSNSLDPQVVRTLFEYHEDGYLTWKVNRSSNARIGQKAGGLTQYGYAIIRISKKHYQAHRVIWLWHFGSLPRTDIDHIDGNKLNNKIENLRIATRGENNLNSKKRIGTSSKYKGVSYNKRMEKWEGYFNLNKKRTLLGLFDSEEEAALAYNKVATSLCKKFVKLNAVRKAT